MSRTDVHRPIHVQQLDPTLRRWFADFHDHSTGPCDLDEFLAATGWTRTRCYRQPWAQSPNLCGCPMCTGQHGRKTARRQERTRWRAARQRALAEHRGGHHDIHIAPIRGEAW